MTDRLEELDKSVIHVDGASGKFFGKQLRDIPLKDLDWLVGQKWLTRKYPEDGALIVEYMSHPTIKKLLNEELSK